MTSHAADTAHARSLDNADTLDPKVPVRWLILLGVPFVVGGALFGTAISTGQMWLMGPASVFGPGAMILGFTYLSLTADTNKFQ
jgi:hypothetical protein